MNDADKIKAIEKILEDSNEIQVGMDSEKATERDLVAFDAIVAVIEGRASGTDHRKDQG